MEAYQTAWAWDDFTNYTDCLTKIDDVYERNSINFYPNPVVNGELKIENSGLKTGDIIQIYDINGKNIVNCQLSIINSINVSALPSGIYFVKIGNKTEKFVKK
ncbi:MAG: T9SS type A sorting domain-containing protein [Tannerella sp.]|nr:T9SS type A sorting domain-containing protein [Tannerella sp.]